MPGEHLTEVPSRPTRGCLCSAHLRCSLAESQCRRTLFIKTRVLPTLPGGVDESISAHMTGASALAWSDVWAINIITALHQE